MTLLSMFTGFGNIICLLKVKMGYIPIITVHDCNYRCFRWLI